MRQLKAHELAILSGILIGCSYIPFPPAFLLFCLLPYGLATVRAKSAKHAFWCGWITQFLLTMIGFHWVAFTAHEFGNLPWLISVPVLLAFSSFSSLHYAIASWIWFKTAKRNTRPISILYFAILFSLLENIFPMIFPWNLGYPWTASSLPIKQTMEWFGAEGLSTYTILFNFLLLNLFLNRSPKNRFLLAGLLSSFLVLNLAGVYLKSRLPENDQSFKVLLVQGNIGNFQKVIAEKGRGYEKDIIDKFINLSNKALQQDDFDLIVFPETAMPVYAEKAYPNRLQKRLENFAKVSQTPLFTGIYKRVKFKTYNMALLFDKEGNWSGDYSKSILLAFGEYFPGTQSFPGLEAIVEKYVPAISHFGRGKGPSAIPMQNGPRIGTQICYEGLYPWFSKGLVEAGAQVFINLTNDSWFGDSFEPYQHMYMTFARAIEFRRPLIRSTNTGYTSVILADGTELKRSPLRKEWLGSYEVPYRSKGQSTFYSKITSFYSYILLVIALLLCFIVMRNARDNEPKGH